MNSSILNFPAFSERENSYFSTENGSLNDLIVGYFQEFMFKNDIKYTVWTVKSDRGKYFYLFADLGQGIVSVKSRNREKFLGDFLEPAMMKLDNGIY